MNFSLYRNRLTGILLLTLCLFTFSSLQAQDILPPPNPPSLVVDKAGVLIKEQKQILEQKLVAIDDSSSNQICVVIIPTLKDYPIEDYAVKLFRSWGIGGSENNNGVLLLIAAQDRQVKIEVGYGLEGAITDVQSKSIIEHDLAPYFQSGNYYRGIDQATTSLAKAAVGEYKVARQGKDGKGGGAIVFFIILAVVIWLVIGSRKGGGGGGGGVASHGGWALLLPMLLGGGRGGGGFGGGGGGFGGGGGGFGGFGGGMSGGGGASGGW